MLIIFFLSCLKTVICELMPLELGDFLGSSLHRIFLEWYGQYFLVNISVVVQLGPSLKSKTKALD